MKVKDLINILMNCDMDSDIVFYALQDYTLEEKELESIQEVDDRLEITIEI
jgi:hypothetical protein